jgi:hypothetical protein
MKHTSEDFAAYLTARETGAVVEVDEQLFDYWLNVLPPKQPRHPSVKLTGMGGIWTRSDGTVQRYSFAQAEGAEELTAFWRTKDAAGEVHYFAQRMPIINVE